MYRICTDMYDITNKINLFLVTTKEVFGIYVYYVINKKFFCILFVSQLVKFIFVNRANTSNRIYQDTVVNSVCYKTFQQYCFKNAQ